MNPSFPSPVTLALGAVVLLVIAPLAGHFLWPDIGWFFTLLFAVLAALMACTVWLVASAFHDPVRRWNLPRAPAHAVQGWRGVLARQRESVGTLVGGLLEKLRRRKPAV
jgi:hypothetical protein